MNPAWDALATQLAQDAGAKLTPVLLQIIEEARRQPMKLNPNQLLTSAEAIEELGISLDKLHELLNGGHILKCKGFKDVRIKRSEIELYGTREGEARDAALAKEAKRKR